ncbi:MAG: RNB domain-containing ribonuclease [Lentisphaeria bacterium]|nr:RNB domain-containing ribonuclease [Lentisphaeria bacterium]
MALLKTDALVLYHGRCACVTALNDDKISIRIEGGGSKSVRPKDIEFLHPGPVTSLPPAELPLPDCQEVAELMEEETFSFADFTELLYSSNSVSAAYSAWKLLSEGMWFSGSVSGGVKVLPPETIAAKLKAKADKENEKAAREALLERIRNGAVQESDAVSLREIEQVAFGRTPSSRLLKDLGIEATPEKAHDLLLKIGFWNELVDPHPARADVLLEDPALELDDLPEEEREELFAMTALAIDDAGSNDPDDAVSFADGLVWVHVADPAAVVTPDSAVDEEARSRGENLYLPEKITHMLPEKATELFGLGLQETSPALSFGIRIAPDGEAVLEKMTLSRIKVKRMSYGDAADCWEEEPLRSLRSELERFKEFRRSSGALFIRLPEVKVKLVDGNVEITPCPVTPERELVANAMLAAGAAVAKFAEENGIPLPFVVQPPPEIEERGESFVEMFALRKACSPGVVQTVSGKHSGLGLEPYVRVTSPLRRYADLLAHQQLRRYLKNEPLMEADELERKLFVSEDAALVRRRLERTCNEFWTLVYFIQHPDWSGNAVFAHRQDDRLTFMIPELAYEFKNRYGGKLQLGEVVNVKLAGVELASLAARLRIE